jgi:hypothetical protein
MSRIVYIVYANGAVQGGQKMAIRHVETLRELGFDAVCRLSGPSTPPTWLSHKVQFEFNSPILPDDILVVPEDADSTLRKLATLPNRTIVLAQNPFLMADRAFAASDRYPADRSPGFITVGPKMVATIRRAFPQAEIDLVPCFADERIFRPAATRRRAVAFSPRKRPFEIRVIRAFFQRFYPERSALDWIELAQVSEVQVAQAFGSASLHLSLSRFESVGMTVLEAMAGGCVCAGFTGVGGHEFATPDNGFWVPDDDCEAAADALAQADDLVQAGGPALRHYLDSAQTTARQWSYAAFRERLEEVWMRLAPGARLGAHALD